MAKSYKMKGKPLVSYCHLPPQGAPGTMGYNAEMPRKRGDGPVQIMGLHVTQLNEPTTQAKMSRSRGARKR